MRFYKETRKSVKTFLLLLLLFFFVKTDVTEGAVCYTLSDLQRPGVSQLRGLSDRFSEPLTKWAKAIIEERYAGDQKIAQILLERYGSPEPSFFFFLDDLNPAPSIDVLKEFINYYVLYENLNFPEVTDIDRLFKEIESLKRNLSMENLNLKVEKSPLLCPSTHTQEGFYIQGAELPADYQRQILDWAGKQLKNVEKLARALLETDILLTALFIRYHLTTRPNHTPEMPDRDTILDSQEFRKLLLSMHPSNHHYKTLRDYITFYKHLADEAQIFLEDPETLKKGMSGHSVLTLQRRLNQEGFLHDGAVNGIFDEATSKAVMAFQALHNLEQDGVVGPKTRKALNIPYGVKLHWIRESLRRMRLFLQEAEGTMIWVNIPTFSLEYYRDGASISSHKIVVGEASGRTLKIGRVTVSINNTLPLASEVEAVVINPRWYVPERIRKELEKEIMMMPDYLEQRNFRYLNSYYSWGEPRIYQLPGETNPLGKVKLLFDNPFGIFLHDTSQPRLFNRSYRAFSHGCIRVEKALHLAQLILSDSAPEQLSKLETFLARKDQTYIALSRPIPIYITYLPVLSDGKGKLLFGGDLYGWGIDEKLPLFFYTKRRP